MRLSLKAQGLTKWAGITCLSVLSWPSLANCELEAIPLHQQLQGCRCEYYLPGKHLLGKQVVIQSRMGTDAAQMFRQGELVAVGGGKERLPAHQPQQWWQLKYHHADLALYLNLQVVSKCQWGESGCNQVQYLGQMNMASNYQQCSWTVRGECGC